MIHFTLDDIVSLCKRRGFIYQGSDIYGGLAGTWDYGPLGVQLKRNITNLWWQTFVQERDDIYGLDSAILMNPKVWEASGHVAAFTDPLAEDIKTKKRYRLDHVLEDNGEKVEGLSIEQMFKLIKDKGIKSPDGNALGSPNQFNLMFQTFVGPTFGGYEPSQDSTYLTGEIISKDKNGEELMPMIVDEKHESDSIILYQKNAKTYLRPETAQGMFVNFRNIIDSFYPDLPFGLAQDGRVFRNEISPRDFVFRVREYELMEFEYFINPSSWEEQYEKMLELMRIWFTQKLGLRAENVHEHEISAADRAHYSKRSVDFEYAFPFGIKEIAGCAYRTDYDLTKHQEKSGKSMEYQVKGTNEKFIPHVIEPTFGVDRNVLAVLCEAYSVDEVGGEKRIFLKLPVHLAPVKAAVSPLLKNKPELVDRAREIYRQLQKELGFVMWDDNGNIGKRYRRQDEIGTPYCITIDFQTLGDGTVTIRDRDSAKQDRIKTSEITKVITGV